MKNKQLAKQEYNKLLEPFDATDIKYTGEEEDTDFDTKSYIANIRNSDKYSSWIDSLKTSNEYEYDSSLEDYIKNTEYGRIAININDEFITIKVEYNEDVTSENLIPINAVNEEFNKSINPERAYDILDNITALADSYDNIEDDVNYEKLLKTIDRIEDEISELTTLINTLKS